MKRIILGFCSLIAFTQISWAQDPHFSQYFSSPLTLNPALTGLTQCDIRIAANMRQQWFSVTNTPYTTGTISIDGRMLKNKWDNGNSLGVGLLTLYDKSGKGGLQNLTVGLSAAGHFALGYEKQHTISIGAQGYLVQKSIDFTKLTFEDQYNGANPGQPYATGETFGQTDLTYPDFNAGFMYTGRISDYATAYAGASFYHLTEPIETFKSNGGDDKIIHRRYTVTAGGSFDLNENLVLHASGLYQNQAKAQEVLVGAAAGFILNPGYDREYSRPTIFYLGGWYRFGDAIIPYISLEMKKFQFGFSYDVNTSNYSAATAGNGAYEFSLIYNGCINKKNPKPDYNWSCPKF